MAMALFFDRRWFDSRLEELGLARDIVAGALQLSQVQVEEVWKDQRELSEAQVSTLAHLLNVTVEEIAHHAGISTPIPTSISAPISRSISTGHPVGDGREMQQMLGLLSQMNDRMTRLEEEVVSLRKLMQGVKDA
ncbi:MAG: hypothetical protein ACJAXQ_000133 [Parvibaculaceae bacterium]|jgi:hypothetical protein